VTFVTPARARRADITFTMNVTATALSGMRAATTRLDVAAHNVANSDTEGYVRQQVIQSDQPAGGTSTTIVHAAHPGADLAQDLVAERTATYSFVASLQAIRTEQEMLGKLLDTRA
jgi:flagellar hook protein FlgE